MFFMLWIYYTMNILNILYNEYTECIIQSHKHVVSGVSAVKLRKCIRKILIHIKYFNTVLKLSVNFKIL